MSLFNLTNAELANAALLAAGAAVILIGLVRVARTRRLEALLTLPTPGRFPVPATDVALVICLFLTLGAAVYDLAATLLGIEVPATTQAADGAPASTSDEFRITILSVSQAINIAVIFMLVHFRYGGRVAGWGLDGSRIPRRVLQALLICLAVWPCCSGLLYLMRVLLEQMGFPMEEHVSIRFLQEGGAPGLKLFATIASAVVLAPILEEFVFRGLLFRFLADQWQSTWAAAIVSGLLFGLIHYSVVQTIVPLAFFGVVLAVAYARTGSLTLAILIHAIFNARTVIWLLIWREAA